MYLRNNFQGTYLDTILPRADIPQNQVQKNWNMTTDDDDDDEEEEEQIVRRSWRRKRIKTRQNMCPITYSHAWHGIIRQKSIGTSPKKK